MKQGEATSQNLIQPYIRAYKIEPLSRVLNKLPLPFVWFIFVFLYFGILTILHGIIGTPRPMRIADIFRHPLAYFYYPNLIAVSFDLIGNPLLLLSLVFFQKYIPIQLESLERRGFLKQRSGSSGFFTLLSRRRTQIVAIIVFPLMFALISMLANIIMFLPHDAPSRYAVFLTGLGAYGKTVVFVQIVYVFVILQSHQLRLELYLKHPDGCGGLAPFGKLAIACYIYIFIYALMQAVGTTAGGGAFEKSLGNNFRPAALTILWILFPLVFAFIFDQLMYRPHRELQQLKERSLLDMSAVWTRLNQRLTHDLVEAVQQSHDLNAKSRPSTFSENLKLIEGMSELNRQVEAVHTWPIPKRTFTAIGVLANPLVPVLIPIVADIAVRMLR